MEQLTSFFSNPNPRIRTPEVKMNSQESMKIRRTHFQGQEVSLSVRLPRSIVRREMRCARMVTPRRWIIALRACVPVLGNIIRLGRSMVVSTPRSGTDAGRVELGGSHPQDSRFIMINGRLCKTRVCPASRLDLSDLNGTSN